MVRKWKLQFIMTINEIFENSNWNELWTDTEKEQVFSKILIPFFSTTDETITNQYILNLVSLFNTFFNNWISLMGNEILVITDKNQILAILKSQFNRWILKNGVKIKNNYESILLSINDEYTTSRTYTINKTNNGSSTYKEGFNGGGLSNQQGTKQTNSTTNSLTENGTDTDKYSQNDTLRKLNYLQLLQPFEFDKFFKELEEIIFAVIWSE